ncbi:MAG: hypothetical protein GC160_04800 [Acidobacteria bacterium]|nr:hypothetical protein [Acidobacteriota bacterium]
MRVSEDPRRRVPELAAALERRGLPHRWLPSGGAEDAAVTAWINTHFRFRGSQADWSAVPDHRSVAWSNEAEAAEALAQAVAGLEPRSLVTVTWGDAGLPSLEIALEDALAVAEAIFEASFDTWILERFRGWALELYHEGSMSWGFL